MDAVPSKKTRRIRREEKTIAAMLTLYCNKHHNSVSKKLCPSCSELKEYAIKRLHCCPFQAKKPTCANCPIHCYNKEMREKVRQVMRYAGPRLVFSHPVLAILHVVDGRIKAKTLMQKNKDTNSK